MIFGARTSTLIASQIHVSQVMLHVIYALLPATFVLLYFYGWGLVSNLLLSLGFAVLLESAFLKLRQRPIQPALQDLSVVVTAWLLAVALPAYSAWWLILVAMIFAVIIAKHLYGGLGYNPFNPAMVGYAAVLISFPLPMTLWPEAVQAGFGSIDLSQALQKVFIGSVAWDGFTQATPLDHVKVNIGLGKTLSDIFQQTPFSWFGSNSVALVNLAYLVGGIWLLYQRVISWHIPTAMLGALSLMASIFWLFNSQQYPSVLFHLLSGATMLGAFFIATDPVTASTTPLGKLIYAAGIGCLVWIIRTWGGYPDGVAFAVLLMNMTAPLLDQYTQPRVYGTRGKR